MLNIGLSTYSMQKEIDSGRMDVIEVMRFAHEIGASNIELVPLVTRFITMKQVNLTIRSSGR